ncbi:MAG: hypothetical protein ACR2PM_09500 [Hyphomicrobiales bacterium]
MISRSTAPDTDYERQHRHLSVADLLTAWLFVAISFAAILLFG